MVEYVLPKEEFYEYKSLCVESELIKQQAANKLALILKRQEEIIQCWQARYGQGAWKINFDAGILFNDLETNSGI